MSALPPKSNDNVPVATEPALLSQPLLGSSEDPSQRTMHNRANEKGLLKTVTLAHEVQKTLVLSHGVPRVDVNREYGQITKVSDTRLTMRPENLARLPRAPVGIIKDLLAWPGNRMLVYVHLHVDHFYFVVGMNILGH